VRADEAALACSAAARLSLRDRLYCVVMVVVEWIGRWSGFGT